MAKKMFAALLLAAMLGWVCLWSAKWAQSSKGRTEVDAPSSSESTVTSISSSAVGRDSGLPHAVANAAKREEIRRRILEAFAQAHAQADEPAKAPAREVLRGQRQTNDLEEFGRFTAQAIREDFIPMVRACAKDLPRDAGGKSMVAFELLSDSGIGAVVNSVETVPAESTLRNPAFETCIRESLYGVYFDPPPASTRATLRFPVVVDEDGNVDDNVEDFHPLDRRRSAEKNR